MECNKCGECCEMTEMPLSVGDIERLEALGYRREKFTVKDREGLRRLRNIDERCYFYDPVKRRCRVYRHRPLGCYLYPVIYDSDKGISIDNYCPMAHTVTQRELARKGRVLMRHIAKIYSEKKSLYGY